MNRIAGFVVASVVVAASLTAAAPARADEPTPTPIVCDTTGILTQSNPEAPVSDVHRVPGGAAGSVPPVALPRLINGIGYRAIDGYVYGWVSATDTEPAGVARFGDDGTLEYLGLPEMTGAVEGEPPLAEMSINMGEVTADGTLWLSWSGRNVIRVDVEPTSPDFLTAERVDGFAQQRPAGFNINADWVERAGEPGILYTVFTDRETLEITLAAYDTATGDLADLGALTVPTPFSDVVGFGGMFADADGFVYLNDNFSGAIYRVDPDEMTVTWVADGPATGWNDGASCRPLPAVIDAGDAPVSYGTLLADEGATHTIAGDAATAPLTIGSGVTADLDGTPVDGDLDDAFAEPLTAVIGRELTVTVPVVNDTGAEATLFAWFDGDADGSFAGDELGPVAVAAGETSVTLTLPSVPAAGQSWLRLRLAPVGDDLSATGPAAGGEVEDWPVTVTPARAAVSLTKTPQATTFDAVGDRLVYTLTATNTGNIPLETTAIADPLCGVAEIYIGDLQPGASLSTYQACAVEVTESQFSDGEVRNTAEVTATAGDVTVTADAVAVATRVGPGPEVGGISSGGAGGSTGSTGAGSSGGATGSAGGTGSGGASGGGAGSVTSGGLIGTEATYGHDGGENAGVDALARTGSRSDASAFAGGAVALIVVGSGLVLARRLGRPRVG